MTMLHRKTDINISQRLNGYEISCQKSVGLHHALWEKKVFTQLSTCVKVVRISSAVSYIN